MVCDVTKKMGGYTRSVLDDTRELIKHEWDVVNLVTGHEGDGKTNFVMLASYYLDPNITLKQWAYNAQQFEEAVDNDALVPGSNIVWDESDELSSKWFNEIIQTLKRKFKRIRKRRLVIWLVTPTFFDMDKYWAIFRTRCLYDIYAEPGRDKENKFHPNRGRLRFFNLSRKTQLYIKGVKNWDMRAARPNFVDSFSKVPSDYPIDMAALEAKKDQASIDLLKKQEQPKINKTAYRREILYSITHWMQHHPGVAPVQKDLADIFGLNVRTLRKDVALNKGEYLDNTPNPRRLPAFEGLAVAQDSIRLDEDFNKSEGEAGLE